VSSSNGRLELVPITLREANRFVATYHRHAEPVRGWRFGVGLERDGELVGVGVAGRPTSHTLDGAGAIELTRVCTLGDPNACSRLYGALCRAAAALGYRTAYTYTLADEPGSSVRAAGFELDAELGARPSWSSPSRPRADETLFGPRKRDTGPRCRWKRELV
jgi:hypothetical protein